MSFNGRVKGVFIAEDSLLPVQSRMARAALGWSLDALAARCGVSRRAILRFEQGESLPRGRTLVAIRAALEAGGIRFAEGGGVFPPV